MAFKDTVKEFFKTGFKPTQAQFYSKFDFLRWKDEKIPIGDIEEIENILNEKADAEALTNHVGDAAAHAALFAAKADAQALLNHIQATFEAIGIELQSRVYGDESLQFQIDDTNDFVSQARSDIDAINTLLTSNDINLDTVQEIVDAIKTVETSLSTILVNDLTTGGTTKALTAEMGKTLKGLIDGLVVPTATDTVRGIVKTDVPVADPVVYVQETVDTLLEGKANYFLDIKPITGISYNPIITDILNQLLYDGTLPMNVIIPNNATVPFPVGSTFYTLATNTGILTASGASGVVLKVKSGISLSAIQNEVRQYTKIGVNTWSVRGDLNLGAVTQTELSYLQGATSNLQAQINAKTALSGGVANRLMKWLTDKTATVSRIWDTGTYLGIGVANAPTKDITLGNQADREIGIEESDNTIGGKTLSIVAGRTINYVPNINFLPINSNIAGLNHTAIAVSSSGSIFTSSYQDGRIYEQTNGVGNFIPGANSYWVANALCGDNNDNIWGAVNEGAVYKKSSGTGVFTDLAQTNRKYQACTALLNGDIYFAVSGGDIYRFINGTGNLVPLGQTIRNWSDIASQGNSTNDCYALADGVVYKRTNATGDFIQIGQTNLNIGSISVQKTTGTLYATSGANVYTMAYGASSFTLSYTMPTGVNAMAAHPNGNMYAMGTVDVFIQNNNAVGTANLSGGTLKLASGTGKGTGISRVEFYTGQKQASGTDMQIETLREYIDENGHHVYTSMPVYADNAAAVAGGLPIGCKYRNVTGDLKIVY